MTIFCQQSLLLIHSHSDYLVYQDCPQFYLLSKDIPYLIKHKQKPYLEQKLQPSNHFSLNTSKYHQK